MGLLQSRSWLCSELFWAVWSVLWFSMLKASIFWSNHMTQKFLQMKVTTADGASQLLIFRISLYVQRPVVAIFHLACHLCIMCLSRSYVFAFCLLDRGEAYTALIVCFYRITNWISTGSLQSLIFFSGNHFADMINRFFGCYMYSNGSSFFLLRQKYTFLELPRICEVTFIQIFSSSSTPFSFHLIFIQLLF